MQTIKCPKCTAVMAVPDHNIELVAGDSLSVVVCRHQHEINCPACSVRMVSRIAEVTVNVGWKMEEKQSSPLIIHPPSLLGLN